MVELHSTMNRNLAQKCESLVQQSPGGDPGLGETANPTTSLIRVQDECGVQGYKRTHSVSTPTHPTTLNTIVVRLGNLRVGETDITKQNF